jgi:hypothetical protein
VLAAKDERTAAITPASRRCCSTTQGSRRIMQTGLLALACSWASQQSGERQGPKKASVDLGVDRDRSHPGQPNLGNEELGNGVERWHLGNVGVKPREARLGPLIHGTVQTLTAQRRQT